MSQVLLIVVVTFVIGIASLHHSVAGAVEVLMAVFANVGPGLFDYWRVVCLSVIGNAIGGAVFVALLNSATCMPAAADPKHSTGNLTFDVAAGTSRARFDFGNSSRQPLLRLGTQADINKGDHHGHVRSRQSISRTRRRR